MLALAITGAPAARGQTRDTLRYAVAVVTSRPAHLSVEARLTLADRGSVGHMVGVVSENDCDRHGTGGEVRS
ncbi:MAG: hypothetical protein AABZ35_08240 [Gemmatimonadota bacterium]